MNPRILKKVCKRIVETGHPITKGAWIDDEDAGGLYIGQFLFSNRRANATAKQWRKHYMAESRITSFYVIGGEPDYWGEATDPRSIYSVALEHIIWKYGEPTKSPLKDDEGNIIDWINDWPRWKGRINAKHVIQRLKTELGK